MQANLTSQMAQSDAAIASMQSQYSYITSVYQAQQVADQMQSAGY